MQSEEVDVKFPVFCFWKSHFLELCPLPCYKKCIAELLWHYAKWFKYLAQSRRGSRLYWDLRLTLAKMLSALNLSIPWTHNLRQDHIFTFLLIFESVRIKTTLPCGINVRILIRNAVLITVLTCCNKVPTHNSELTSHYHLQYVSACQQSQVSSRSNVNLTDFCL